MMAKSDQKHDPGFSGQLTLLGVAIVVLLFYAWACFR
jgi:hypothetical protein